MSRFNMATTLSAFKPVVDVSTTFKPGQIPYVPARDAIKQAASIIETMSGKARTLGLDADADELFDASEELRQCVQLIATADKVSSKCWVFHSWTKWVRTGVATVAPDINYPSLDHFTAIVMVRECVHCHEIQHKLHKTPTFVS